jgi:hypothetical protein
MIFDMKKNSPNEITVVHPPGVSTIKYAIRKLEESSFDHRLVNSRSSEVLEEDQAHQNLVLFSDNKIRNGIEQIALETRCDDIDDGGYRIETVQHGENKLVSVVSPDDRGILYGMLSLREKLANGKSLSDIQNKTVSPEVETRAIKFNLPWHAFREGPQSDIHLETCRDVEYWRSFLDMMAENRLNVLTLWNLHPFSYMIESDKYPEACSLSEEELAQLHSYKSKIVEKSNQLNGRKNYDRIAGEDLDEFADYVQQDMEQADRVLTISLTTALLIVIILLLL